MMQYTTFKDFKMSGFSTQSALSKHVFVATQSLMAFQIFPPDLCLINFEFSLWILNSLLTFWVNVLVLYVQK